MSSTDEYQRTDTPTPPLLVIVEGRVYVEVTNGSLTMRAPVGDGSWFFSQVVTKLVDPALRAAYPRAEFASPEKALDERMEEVRHPL